MACQKSSFHNFLTPCRRRYGAAQARAESKLGAELQDEASKVSRARRAQTDLLAELAAYAERVEGLKSQITQQQGEAAR